MSTTKKIARSVKTGIAVGSSQTLADALMDRGLSLPRAMTVCRWVALWGLYREATGQEPESVDAIVAVTKVNRRTAFRWQSAFREAFPEYQSPALLWEMVKGDLRSEDPNVAAVQIGAAQL